MRALSMGAGLLGLVFSSAVSATDVKERTLNVVAESAYPAQYNTTTGVKGTAASVVRSVLDKAGYKYNIKLIPWSRAYQMAQDTPNTIIFSMTRTLEREDKFHWIAVTGRPEYHLLRIKKDNDDKPIDSNWLKKARIGVVRNDVTQKKIKALGYTKIETVVDSERLLKLALKERVDTFPFNIKRVDLVCKRLFIKCPEFESVLKLSDKITPDYMALSINSSPELVSDLKKAQEQLSTSEFNH